MGRRPLKLPDLIAAGVFDATNFRHRRCLDESEPLDNPELEELRQRALYFRGRNDSKYGGAKALRQFADAVTDRQE